jgi:hypothetical protein
MVEENSSIDDSFDDSGLETVLVKYLREEVEKRDRFFYFFV